MLQSGAPLLSCQLSKVGPRSVGMKSLLRQRVFCPRRKRKIADKVVPMQALKGLILRMTSSSCPTVMSWISNWLVSDILLLLIILTVGWYYTEQGLLTLAWA
jgi:hypothetical protein